MITDSSRPFLANNEIWGNGDGGVYVHRGADPTLSANIIRDHRGIGVLVADDAVGLATIQPGNVFLRNTAGDVVRAARGVRPRG